MSEWLVYGTHPAHQGWLTASGVSDDVADAMRFKPSEAAFALDQIPAGMAIAHRLVDISTVRQVCNLFTQHPTPC